MASKGGGGIELVMDDVPQREIDMTPYEMMLSESQERMLMVLKPGREPEAEAIFRKWELDFAVIGHVTDTGRMVLKWQGDTVCDIPLGPLADRSEENTSELQSLMRISYAVFCLKKQQYIMTKN